MIWTRDLDDLSCTRARLRLPLDHHETTYLISINCRCRREFWNIGLGGGWGTLSDWECNQAFPVKNKGNESFFWQIKTYVQELKSETEKVTQWYKVNLLQANPNKYQIIAIDPKLFIKELVDKLLLQIDNQLVKSFDKITILGVNIDEKLTFSEHGKDINKRASQKVRVLLRLHNLIPCSAKLQLYKFAILLHLTYCDIVWQFFKSSDKCQISTNSRTYIESGFYIKYRVLYCSLTKQPASLPCTKDDYKRLPLWCKKSRTA